MKAILRSKSNSDQYYLKFDQMLEFLVDILYFNKIKNV